MNSCKDCKWYGPGGNNDVCNWNVLNDIPIVPAYYVKISLSSVYPYQLFGKDLGKDCRAFEVAGTGIRETKIIDGVKVTGVFKK